MSTRRSKTPVPHYPRLAELRARPVLAGIGAALLGAAALAGCGLDPVEEANYLPTAAAAQAVPDAGRHLLRPVVIAPEPPDSGPDASEYSAGFAAEPNPDGGPW